MTSSTRKVRAVRVADAAAVFDYRPGGTVYVRSPRSLSGYPEKITERLEHWASSAPERTFLARRGSDGEWQRVTYSQTLARVRAIAQSLLDKGLSAERPIAILSGNSIEHALLALAAMYTGVLYAPIAPAYSLAVKTFGTLEKIISTLQPAMIFADDGPSLRKGAAQHASGDVAEVVVAESAPAGIHSRRTRSSKTRHPHRP